MGALRSAGSSNAQKGINSAGIVRDAMLQQLPGDSASLAFVLCRRVIP